MLKKDKIMEFIGNSIGVAFLMLIFYFMKNNASVHTSLFIFIFFIFIPFLVFTLVLLIFIHPIKIIFINIIIFFILIMSNPDIDRFHLFIKNHLLDDYHVKISKKIDRRFFSLYKVKLKIVSSSSENSYSKTYLGILNSFWLISENNQPIIKVILGFASNKEERKEWTSIMWNKAINRTNGKEETTTRGSLILEGDVSIVNLK